VSIVVLVIRERPSLEAGREKKWEAGKQTKRSENKIVAWVKEQGGEEDRKKGTPSRKSKGRRAAPQ